uniref:Putative secreted protein n=1 Tax=Anopheles darlingi TaxID=43151 RepID=A0A2M4DA61_ANODA
MSLLLGVLLSGSSSDRNTQFLQSYKDGGSIEHAFEAGRDRKLDCRNKTIWNQCSTSECGRDDRVRGSLHP